MRQSLNENKREEKHFLPFSNILYNCSSIQLSRKYVFILRANICCCICLKVRTVKKAFDFYYFVIFFLMDDLSGPNEADPDDVLASFFRLKILMRSWSWSRSCRRKIEEKFSFTAWRLELKRPPRFSRRVLLRSSRSIEI